MIRYKKRNASSCLELVSKILNISTFLKNTHIELNQFVKENTITFYQI